MTVSAQGRTLDHVANIYDYLCPAMTFFQEGRISRKVIGLLELEGEERVLDVGCGTGTFTIEIAKRLRQGHESMAIGIDAAPKMIARARKKSKEIANVSFEVAAAQGLPFEDGFFDIAVSAFFFHHIGFELKKMALRQIWRVLKKNGILIIVDVDVPTNIFGALCAWSGYLLFQQEEIRENITGRLGLAFDSSPFRSWQKLSQYLGYISIFKLVKS